MILILIFSILQIYENHLKLDEDYLLNEIIILARAHQNLKSNVSNFNYIIKGEQLDVFGRWTYFLISLIMIPLKCLQFR